jgi:hypothetical protein
MGVNTSPDICHHIVDKVLGDVLIIQIYRDEILIASTASLEEHSSILKTVFGRSREVTLRENLLKCYFAEPNADYLGY